MVDRPVPPPPADFPRLQWQSLREMPSQLPVGDYSQYEVAFSRPSKHADVLRLYVHAIQRRNSYMEVVAMGFQVSADPVGLAVAAGGEAGFYLDPDMLAWARRHGESLSIPIESYHLFSGTGLSHRGRTWYVGSDAVRDYFGRHAQKASARTERVKQGQQERERHWERRWFQERARQQNHWISPFQKELGLLGLDSMPATLSELKLAWKEKLRGSHPDVGGSTSEAQEIGAAFEKLRSHLEFWSQIG